MSSPGDLDLDVDEVRAEGADPWEMCRAFVQLADQGPGRRAPFIEYVNDPVRFFVEILGIEPWGRHAGLPPDEASQVDILTAVRDYDMVAVRSGHKVSKSCSAAGIGLWWVGTRPHGRVILTAPAGHQVESILWTEIRDLVARTHPAQQGKTLPPMPGVIHVDPHNGYELAPGWGMWGVTTNKPERMSGKSGAEQLFIVDEASGYPEDIFVSVFGNMAGGGKVVLFSNPTRTSGTFFDAFNDKRGAWKTLHVSSLNTPNFHGGNVPGLANPNWHETIAKKLWGGPGNPLYDMRALGNFPSQSENGIVPMVLMEQGMARWQTTEPADDDELDIGVDVARGGEDESILAPRRGLKVFELEAVPVDKTAGALPPGPQIGEAVVRMARRMRKVTDRLRPRVKVDAIGVGTAVLDYLALNYAEEMEIVGVNTSCAAETVKIIAAGTDISPPKTAADEYRNLRTQILFGITAWLREGGAIPQDPQLGKELVATSFYFVTKGKLAAEDKDEVKRRIRCSPDRADAVALAIYDPRRSDGDGAPNMDDLNDGYRLGDGRGFG